MNGTSSFYECRFSGRDTSTWWDTHTLPYAKELFALRDVRDAKTFGMSNCLWVWVLTPEPPGGICTT